MGEKIRTKNSNINNKIKQQAKKKKLYVELLFTKKRR